MAKESSLLEKFENDELKKLFVKIVGTKDWNNSVADKFKCELDDLNPWKENLVADYGSDDFLSLAKNEDENKIKKDEEVLKALLIENIKYNKELIDKKEKLSNSQKSILKMLVEESIRAPFQDYEQAFDGNLETPKVLFLGINPKFVYGHEDYGLKETVYTHIFDKNRPPLNKLGTHKAGSKKELSDADYKKLNNEKDYYFRDGGFFYSKSINEELRNKHRIKCLCTNQETPVAFIELFPYASSSDKTWLKLRDSSIDLKISPPIRDYIQLKKLLYSQQWLLCLIAFVLKNNKNLVIFLRTNNNDSRPLLTELFKLIYGDKLNERIKNNQILVKAGDQDQKFWFDKVKRFDIREGADTEFFKSIWSLIKEKS